MSEHQSIEDVLLEGGRKLLARRQTDALAAANLPIKDEHDRIAVIRLDPELASWLNEQADHYEWEALGLEGFERDIAIAKAEYLRRAARIIGGETE